MEKMYLTPLNRLFGEDIQVQQTFHKDKSIVQIKEF